MCSQKSDVRASIKTHVLKEQILQRKFKIRANYASSDYETVCSIEISPIKGGGNGWAICRDRPAIRSDDKVKSRSQDKGGRGVRVEVACGKYNFS